MIDPELHAALIQNLCDLPPDHPDLQTTAAILREAAQFATNVLEPGAAPADAAGCRLQAGRVIMPACSREAWRQFVEQGWNGLGAPEAHGGQGLPLTIATAAQIEFDAANVALGMLAVNQRCAIRLLLKSGTPELREKWIPRFADGSWGTTICISEPDAGSDVGRIRTRAEPAADGQFRITGQKCWISYGDHDLSRGIVHFILARSPDLPPGSRGLTLFMLPDQDEAGRRNGVTVLRVEDKLGLRASPTCALAFEQALAIPLSAPGRGLAALYDMIVVMRLAVAAQGCAIAGRSAAIAARYAFERGQGGPPDAPPIKIHHHAEVRRALLEMQLNAAGITALTLQVAAWIEAGDQGDARAAACAGVLLPVVKALGSETGFANAHAAIQVLGGAGYTRDWPLERMLRDARVFSVYEGTTAIQALDLTFRQLLGHGQEAVADVLDRLGPARDLQAPLLEVISRIRSLDRAAQERAALPLLRLFGLVCTDGALRRHAGGAGAFAPRFKALLGVHEILAGTEVERLTALCAAPDLQQAFEAVFSGMF
jgi:alkylation response protein AidB-like acyl-CoA dehydrogenase